MSGIIFRSKDVDDTGLFQGWSASYETKVDGASYGVLAYQRYDDDSDPVVLKDYDCSIYTVGMNPRLFADVAIGLKGEVSIDRSAAERHIDNSVLKAIAEDIKLRVIPKLETKRLPKWVIEMNAPTFTIKTATGGYGQKLGGWVIKSNEDKDDEKSFQLTLDETKWVLNQDGEEMITWDRKMSEVQALAVALTFLKNKLVPA